MLLMSLGLYRWTEASDEARKVWNLDGAKIYYSIDT